MRPLILLDDGHELLGTQREALLKKLVSRELAVSRWYSERLEALSPEEVLQSVGIEGRDYELLDLERRAAEGTGRGRSWFEKLVTDIGNLRAVRSLERYEGGDHSFTDLLEADDDDLLGSSEPEVLEKLATGTHRLADSEHRYQSWIETVEQQRGYVAARRWRELAILIERDRARPNLDLFDVIVATHKTIDLVFHTQVYKLKREMTRKHLASASSVSFRQNDVLEVNDERPAHSPATDCGRPASVGARAQGAQDYSGTPGGPGCK